MRSITRPMRGEKIAPTPNITVMPLNTISLGYAEIVAHLPAQHGRHQEGGAPADDLREAEPGRGAGGRR